MGTEDPGDSSIQPPPRNERQSDKLSSSSHGSIVSQTTGAYFDENSYECHPSRSTTRNNGECSPVHHSVVAAARIPATQTIDGEVPIESDQEIRSLDIETRVALHEPRSTTPDSPPSYVPEPNLGHATNQYDYYTDLRPALRSGRQRERVPGFERIGRHRPDLSRENSNDTFGGNTVVSNQQPAQQQDLLVVHAHLVEESDSVSNKPVVVAKQIIEKKKNRNKYVILVASVLVLLAVGLGVGISMSSQRNGSTQNPFSTNQTSAIFVEKLPTFLSPKSKAALSTPGSAQSQARSWIESLPIHNTMTIERLKQRYALAAFFFSTGDQMWCNNDRWLSESDECTWFSRSSGPVCAGGVYITLNLAHNCLQVDIPDDIFLLSSLRTLNLTDNVFMKGIFPQPLFSLTSLTSLGLRSCAIEGTIPGRLKVLSNLESLDISYNVFTGNIAFVMALTGLKKLDFSGNLLTGPIPTEIGQLSKLVELTNIGNVFQAFPDTELGPSRRLDTFHRREGVVISGIPSEIGNLTNLRRLEISFGSISGEIPSEISRLMKLKSLILYYNQFTGTIPRELFGMTNLERMDLSNNLLTGALSPDVDQMTSLRSLLLGVNSLEGSLPAQIGNATSLRRLDLSTNHFSGTIPSSLGNLDQLRHLELSKNKFVGSIPTDIGKLEELSELYLDFNSLSGTIPTEFGNFGNLTTASFDNNNLTNSIPTELGRLRNNVILSLCNTAVVGPIPAEICENDAESIWAFVNCTKDFVPCACCMDCLTTLLCDVNAT
jgi:Leucine-rich repeat (LRR) protein